MAEPNTNVEMDARAGERDNLLFLENVSYTPASVGYWTLSGVEYRGQKWSVDLMRGLLPARTQDEHAQHWFDARQRGDFHAADLPLHIGIFRKVYELHESKNVSGGALAKDVRAFLREQLNNSWLMTLTRVQYRSEAPDIIFHGYGLPMTHSYQEQADVVGTNGKIETFVSSELGAVFLGTPRVRDVSKALEWMVGGSGLKLWRISRRSSESQGCVAGFCASSGGADLYCSGGPSGSCSSLGVRMRPQKNFADPYAIVVSEVQEYPYGTPADLERKSIADLILQQKNMNESDVNGLRRVVEKYFDRNGGKE